MPSLGRYYLITQLSYIKVTRAHRALLFASMVQA